jgi:hypothetical protein
MKVMAGFIASGPAGLHVGTLDLDGLPWPVTSDSWAKVKEIVASRVISAGMAVKEAEVTLVALTPLAD